MVSYQCSPLSTPEGIVGTFAQCAKLQENQQLDKFVSVVVLDEVGLAEDSPRMPLKVKPIRGVKNSAGLNSGFIYPIKCVLY
jgi:hypothetical protein